MWSLNEEERIPISFRLSLCKEPVTMFSKNFINELNDLSGKSARITSS